MSKRFITTIVAAAIAVAGMTASPVQAGDRGENTRLLFGVLTLGTILAIANENQNKKRKSSQATQTQPRQDAHRYEDRRRDADRQRHGNKTQRRHAKPLPASCRRVLETRHGVKRVFARKCLERKYSQLHRLPSNCFQRIKTYDGMRRGYGSNCLRRHGFQVARY